MRTKGTKKRYSDCQEHPTHVFNNPEVELVIGTDPICGVMIQTPDGTLRYRLSAHVHGGNLVLDITTPDNRPAVVIGNVPGETPRRKVIIYQGNLEYLKTLESKALLGRNEAEEAASEELNIKYRMDRA